MSIFPPPELEDGEAQDVAPPKTVEHLATQGIVRYPDLTSRVDYVETIRQLSDSPHGFCKQALSQEEANRSVVIVGAGMSGLIAAYELKRAGFQNLTILDAGDMSQSETQTQEPLSFSRTYTTAEGFEIGAMRFPDKAKLFWHYVATRPSLKTQPVQPFSNPGQVPTLLVYQGESHLFQNQIQPLPPKFLNIKKRFDRMVEHLMKDKTSLQWTTSQFTKVLYQEQLTEQERHQIKTYWNDFLCHFKNKSFYDVLIEEGQFDEEAVNILYTIGLGTGPFGALFEVAFADMYRILIWQYTQEYSLAPHCTVQGITHAFAQDFKIRTNTNVTGVWRCEGGQVVIETNTLEQGKVNTVHEKYDYAIIATSHRSMSQMMGLADSSKSNPERLLKSPFNPYHTFPNETISQEAEVFLKRLIDALQKTFMIDATKTFVSLKQPPWEVPELKEDWPRIHGEPVQTIISDTLCQQSYIVTTKTGYGLLLSYAWGDECSRQEGLQHVQQSLIPDSWKVTSNVHVNILQQSYNELALGGKSTTETKVLYNLIQKCNAGLSPENIACYTFFWQQAPGVYGGFKLNKPNQHEAVTTLAHQNAIALASDSGQSWFPESYRKIFLAGESCSFYGGWVEGAAFAGVNAAAGVMYEINRHKLHDNVRKFVSLPNV